MAKRGKEELIGLVRVRSTRAVVEALPSAERAAMSMRKRIHVERVLVTLRRLGNRPRTD